MNIVPTERTKYKSKTKKDGTNGEGVIEHLQPYSVEIAVVGTAPLLCNRYDVDVVEEQANAPKGSKKKKTDNVEAKVYRLQNGECGMPGINFKRSLVEAARFSQDPRSPRKSAMDIFRAGIKVTEDASFGKDSWDYIDKRRVCINRGSAVTRCRPAFLEGWKLIFIVEVLLPEYIDMTFLQEVAERAGKTGGLGDFRPDFGCFRIESFKEVKKTGTM